LIKKAGIAFVATDKNNSAESFQKMGCGEDDLFSKRGFPAKPFGNSLFFVPKPASTVVVMRV